MAFKWLASFIFLISISGIFSKTLLEKIRDDSDLSQVSSSFFVILFNLVFIISSKQFGHCRHQKQSFDKQIKKKIIIVVLRKNKIGFSSCVT